jgi:XrtJ-associated TM-motif-TM protein
MSWPHNRIDPPECEVPIAPENEKTMKKTLILMAFALAVFVSVPAHAQGGCDDSPENPTLILAGLAGGAYTVSQLRTRLRTRRALKNRSN